VPSHEASYSPLLYIWFFGMLALVLTVAVRTAIVRARQRHTLQPWATSMGWTYQVRDRSLRGRWQGPPFAQTPSEQQYSDVITGTDRGHPFTAMVGEYHKHMEAILVIQLPASAPSVQVRPAGLEAMLMGSTVRLESEDFNRRFRVYADDPKSATDLLTPRVMAALLAGPDLSWRTSDWELIAWWPGEIHPAQLIAAQATLQHVIEGMPSFVANKYGTDPTTGPPGAPTEATHLVPAGHTAAGDQPSATAPAPLPPPGWFLDPHDPNQARFWNGAAWTTRTGAIRPR
jgi:Protein of unknown function (DUF3137)/Protein of unknown function (DUF2510)